MTEHEFTRLGDYIRWVANAMGLRDWHFVLLREPPHGDDAWAEVFPTVGRKAAQIVVCADFRTLRPEEQRHAIVHELLHCHLAQATDVIRLDLGDARLVSQSHYDLLWYAFKRQIEYAVDGMAAAWADTIPLITWNTEEAEHVIPS